ncbi:MAG: hypothetical protein NZ872_04815 [Archaeoglobaceae archaeon]|nr:hypothetical protein [Archaeoglobaceae archaeon]MDW8128522.1 hypothetical protein [Archaeoglobaceae archaeon]
MRTLIVATIILLLMHTAMGLETLTSANFSIEIKISPEKDYFFAGDTVQVNYVISPKSANEKLKIGGEPGNPRSYYFRTPLLNPDWILEIKYAGVSGVKQDFKDSSIAIEVKYYSIAEEGREGVDYISANLIGKVPETNLRLKEMSVLVASAEEATSDALKPANIRVVNKTAFIMDLSSLRVELSNTKSKLDAEGIRYGEEEFKSAENLLKQAENAFNGGEYILADDTLKRLKEKIVNLTNLADKLRAEEIYQKLYNSSVNLTTKLEELQLLIQSLRGTENFANLSSNFASLKANNELLRNNLRVVKDYIDRSEFAKAYEEGKKLEISINELREKVEKLYNEASYTQKSGGIDIISIVKNYSIYIFAIFLAIVLIFAINTAIGRLKKRRKWDELK